MSMICDKTTRGANRIFMFKLSENKFMYFVYILSNENNTVLYVGVTNDIQRRINEHKNLPKSYIELC